MPGKQRIFLDVDNLIRDNAAGVTVKQLAARHGCNVKTITATLARAGIKPVSANARRQAEALGAPPEVIRELYAQNVPILQIARRFGVHRNAITTMLRQEGIHIRGRSEAERLKWRAIKATPGGVERQCAAAWDGARKAPTTEVVARRAIGHQRSVTRVGRHERELMQALQGHGLAVTPQRAIHTYNLDLALDVDRVAVEILTSGTSKAHATRHREKAESLINRGWAVVWVLVTDPEQVAGCAEDVIALLDLFRREPAARGQDWVIRRDGESAIPRGLKGEHRSAVLATRERLHT
jgi:lambda repressor-like predicted transcriptional regulator/very-short-patch-repair endonuclease